ncbi:MAG: HD domain-containing protein [Candidatus Thermoplasmatota archaeon]
MTVIVRDPIHGSIPLEGWALPLVDSPVVQRLRRVHQLGTAHLVYPGARHSRFEHSLGAHHLAGRLAVALGLTPEETRTVRAAALLHDVGHGPFSHAFEELVKETGRRHEETSGDLISWGPLADLLRQGGLDPVAVAEAVAGKGPLAPLVSGSLDADRTDYLLRDAHYTGVPSLVDPDRLLEVVARDPKHGIVLLPSGLTAAEALLTTRFLMYPAVYLHRTVRSTESMLLAAIRALIAAGHATLQDLERETDDQVMARLRSAGGEPAELASRLDERRLYKRALEFRPAAHPEWGRLAKDGPARRRLAAQLADAAGLPHHQALLDVPQQPKFRELALQVAQADGTHQPLPEASRLVGVMQEARDDHWRAWLFCPKGERERLGRIAQRELGDLAVGAVAPPSGTAPPPKSL